MRIAITTWSSRRVGGVETYLSEIIPALADAQHEIAIFHEVDVPISGERLVPESDVPSWSADNAGHSGVMAALAAWKPDVIYAHGARDAKFDRDAGRIAPTVFFIHNYHGTCVGGMKTFKYPVPTPCDRRFGWPCLLHYYPRRCGGLNPITMMRQYHAQSQRLKVVLESSAVVTHSHHMYCEFAKHGVPSERLHRFPYYAGGQLGTQHRASTAGISLPVLEGSDMSMTGSDLPRRWHIAFVGRMEQLKGGGYLLDALPLVTKALGVPLEVTFAGDGTSKALWEKQATALCARQTDLEVRFTGWVDKSEVERIIGTSDLVVVPSVWPEPFGLVGPEAGWRGIPVAGFAVGGVRDWLIDGVNGFMAPGDPPTSEGLAYAIIQCLRDPDTYERLRRGAVEMAQRFNRRDHLRSLIDVLESVRRRT